MCRIRSPKRVSLVGRAMAREARRAPANSLEGAGTVLCVFERSGGFFEKSDIFFKRMVFLSFHARVGGPLVTARADAASILQLLRDVRQHYIHRVHLLIFVDCLVVLDIL